jgi:hypothetical protein
MRQYSVLLQTGRLGFDPRKSQSIFPVARPSLRPTGTGGPFPGGKAQPGRDSGHSAPTSGEVKN